MLSKDGVMWQREKVHRSFVPKAHSLALVGPSTVSPTLLFGKATDTLTRSLWSQCRLQELKYEYFNTFGRWKLQIMKWSRKRKGRQGKTQSSTDDMCYCAGWREGCDRRDKDTLGPQQDCLLGILGCPVSFHFWFSLVKVTDTVGPVALWGCVV